MREFEQDPSEALDYAIDFAGHCARFREPDTDYAINTQVRPKKATGLQYKATTGGHSATNEPRWPTTAGATVVDGSVVWTAEPITAGSLARALSGATWSSVAGITLGSPSTSGTKSTVVISGGVGGQDYEMVCEGACSDGTMPVVTFIVKIRRPTRVVTT